MQTFLKQTVNMKNKKRFKIPIDMIPKTYLMTLSCALSSNSTIKTTLLLLKLNLVQNICLNRQSSQFL